MDEPFYEINKDKKYNYFVIDVKLKKDSDDHLMIYDMLSGFSTNEWIFNQYVQYYSEFLTDELEINFYEYKNLTYKDFLLATLKDTGRMYEQCDWIDYGTIALLDTTVFYNGKIQEESYQYETDFDRISNEVIPYISESYHMLKICEPYLGNEFKEIIDIIDRIYNIYLFVMVCSTYTCEKGNYFALFPDYVKTKITKVANFPAPIETLEYYDCIDYDYFHKLYIDMYRNEESVEGR